MCADVPGKTQTKFARGNQNRSVKSIRQSDKLVFERPDETFTTPPMTVDGRGQIQNRLRRHFGRHKPFPAVMIIIVVVLSFGVHAYPWAPDPRRKGCPRGRQNENLGNELTAFYCRRQRIPYSHPFQKIKNPYKTICFYLANARFGNYAPLR